MGEIEGFSLVIAYLDVVRETCSDRREVILKIETEDWI